MKKPSVPHSASSRKLFRGFILAFLAVFVLRWGYEVFFSSHDILLSGTNWSNSNFEVSSKDSARTTNYASSKITVQDTKGQAVTIDQKYEKTAFLSATTTAFAADNTRLRQVIADQDAVIQAENLSGLSGSQTLAITIGVVPEHFDTLAESLRDIGSLQSLTINKVDKTDAYRKLLASQATLTKTRESYAALKEMGGSIQDLLTVEEKLLEVERNLQELGVDIGLFSSEQSFCTVNFTLREVAKQTVSVRFLLRCLQTSFFWTLGVFVLLTLVPCAAWLFSAAWLHTKNAFKKDAADDDSKKAAPADDQRPNA